MNDMSCTDAYYRQQAQQAIAAQHARPPPSWGVDQSHDTSQDTNVSDETEDGEAREEGEEGDGEGDEIQLSPIKLDMPVSQHLHAQGTRACNASCC